MNLWYVLLILPGLLAWWAQAKVRHVHEEYGGRQNAQGITGLEVTRRLLAHHDLTDVKIDRTEGHFTDHFDPKADTIHLTDGVANTKSITAMGIAAHEVAHAVQDAEGYHLSRLRAFLGRWVERGAQVSSLAFVGGMLFRIPVLQVLAGALLALFALFALVTLPVELHASRTAIQALETSGLANTEDRQGVKRVLRSAALTYVTGLGRQMSSFLFFVAVVGAARG
ncbi:MAG: zinc metallopeptidase [Anaerolineae bacterium]